MKHDTEVFPSLSNTESSSRVPEIDVYEDSSTAGRTESDVELSLKDGKDVLRRIDLW